MSVSYGGDSITFADGSVQSGGWTGMRNRIINGAMTIDQRSAGANTVVSSSAPYTLDRFRVQCANQTGTMNVRQDSTAATGFVSSLRTIVTTANTSMPSAGVSRVFTALEGNAISDFGWGTADAKTVTLSFWVRSSNTGTFSGSITNYAEDRSYPFTYTINSANTWEYETITIPGDTSGTWPTGTAGSLQLNFDLGSGSTQLGTANAWTGSWKLGVTGATSLMGVVGNNWYVTGIQLERGSTASSFEYRPYGTELTLCQRYYQKFENISGGEATGSLATGIVWTSTNFFTVVPYITTMRALPTGTSSGSTAITLLVNGAAKQSSAITIQQFSKQAFEIVGTSSSMTGGQAGFTRFTGSTDYIALSAEL